METLDLTIWDKGCESYKDLSGLLPFVNSVRLAFKGNGVTRVKIY